jgi:hypothetical protein
MTKIAGSGSASASGSISQRHGPADPDPGPDPHQNVMDPQHWSILLPRTFMILFQVLIAFFLSSPSLCFRMQMYVLYVKAIPEAVFKQDFHFFIIKH